MQRVWIIALICAFTGKALADPGVVWIDVRSASEYAAGHLQQAVLIPHGDILTQIDQHVDDKNQTVYLYCRSGNRAGIAKKALEDAGYSRVFNIGSLQQASELSARGLPADDLLCCL